MKAQPRWRWQEERVIANHTPNNQAWLGPKSWWTFSFVDWIDQYLANYVIDQEQDQIFVFSFWRGRLKAGIIVENMCDLFILSRLLAWGALIVFRSYIATTNGMKLILKSMELKGLWGLEEYQGGAENVDSL